MAVFVPRPLEEATKMTSSHVVAVLASAALALPALISSDAPHQRMQDSSPSAPSSDASTTAVTTERLAGEDRYATAAAVAGRWSTSDVVYITSAGTEESLLASVHAAAGAAPLLYTRPSSLPGSTRSALEKLKPEKIIVVGSPTTVSDSVLAELRQVAPVTRAWEGGIFATGAALTAASSRPFEKMYLVSPTSADAFSTAAAAAAEQSHVILTPADRLDPHTAELLRSSRPTTLVVVGGTVAIKESVAKDAAAAAGLSTVDRVAGADRFETAALLAERMPTWSGAHIANGDLPVDAFVAAPLAAESGAPVVLTRATAAPTVSLDTVSQHAPSSLTAVGGTGVVDDATFGQFTRAATKGSGGTPTDPVWGAPTWSDEFTGSRVDTSNWEVRDGTYLGYDWAVITKDAVSVQDGMLRIRMQQLPNPVVKEDGRQRYWTTGYLDTIGRQEARYGRWEIRAKVPTKEGKTRGVWPAFWLRNGDEGEIDIMEAWGGPEIRDRRPSLHNTSRFTVHESTNHTGDSKGWEYEHQLWPGKHPYNTPADFHEWAVEYTPDYLKAYLDDELAIHITPTKEHVSGVAGDFSWVWGPTFQSPWNMRLNMQMGNDYGTPGLKPSPYSVMPADYLVDYVRFYAYDG